MIALVRQHYPTAIALLTGFIIAVLLAPLVLATADWYAQWDETHNPPSTLQWQVIERLDIDTLRMTLLVTRNKDCQMVKVLGYTGNSLQAMHPAETLEREDGRRPQSYPVGITVISKPWILRGIYGSKVAVSAYYDCNDRIVKAPLLIGDVPAFEP